jgi:hypothetical protein
MIQDSTSRTAARTSTPSTSIKRFAATVVVLASAAYASSALASDMPVPSPAFGAHVAGMTPDHAAHGRMFGQCVSEAAR